MTSDLAVFTQPRYYAEHSIIEGLGKNSQYPMMTGRRQFKEGTTWEIHTVSYQFLSPQLAFALWRHSLTAPLILLVIDDAYFRLDSAHFLHKSQGRGGQAAVAQVDKAVIGD